MKKDAAFYYLDHLESSIIPHSMLHKIIQKLKMKQNDSLTLPEKAYLLRNKLNALYALVEGKISFNQYKKESSNDRVVYKKRLEEEQIRLEKLKELERIEEQKRQEKLAQERKRDLKKPDTAIEHGLKAHDHSSQDYRSCTLLGAIYMENHEYDLGHDWYSKARDREGLQKTLLMLTSEVFY
ncbi:TPA: hypothetical protein ACKE7S_003600 [Acinetobacter baumannii]